MQLSASPRARPIRAADLALAAFILVCHSFGGILYFRQRGGFGLPAGWDAQFLVLLSLSLGLSLFAVAFRRLFRAKVAVVVVFLCYLLLIFPLPISSGVQLAIGMPIIMETTAVFSKPAGIVSSMIIIVSTVFLDRAELAWGRAIPPSSPEELGVFAFVLATLCAFSLSFWSLDAFRRRALREVGRLDRAIGRLSEINAAFQDALASADEDFSLRERNRITREIHDIIGYALTNQQMMLEAALLLTGEDDGRLRELLGMARSTVSDGLQDARRALYELRKGESRPEDLGFGVLLKVVRNFESVTGVRVAVDFTNARGELSRETWLMLYRLVQESMINAFRHGDAKNIAITFREDDKSLFVNVRDDGRGAAALAEGIGLKGMRERAEALGGELWAGNAADGFAVSSRLPKMRGKEEEDGNDEAAPRR